MSKKETTIDDLARMVAQGFTDMGERFSGEIQLVRQEISDVKTELKQEISDVKTELKQEISSIRVDVAKLRKDVLEIKSDVKILRQRTLEDDDALVSENIKREREIKDIRREIRELKLAHS